MGLVLLDFLYYFHKFDGSPQLVGAIALIPFVGEPLVMLVLFDCLNHVHECHGSSGGVGGVPPYPPMRW